MAYTNPTSPRWFQLVNLWQFKLCQIIWMSKMWFGARWLCKIGNQNCAQIDRTRDKSFWWAVSVELCEMSSICFWIYCNHLFKTIWFNATITDQTLESAKVFPHYLSRTMWSKTDSTKCLEKFARFKKTDI